MTPNGTLNFDVVVIGGGPAGAAAAYRCCKLGLSTALIDKSRFPRDKLCGGLITGRARRAYFDLFDADPPQDVLLRKDAAAFWHQGISLGLISDIPPLFLTMRRTFDAHLFDLAIQAGANDFSGQRIQSYDLAHGGVTLADGRTIAGQVVIGADGVNSGVAKALFGAAYDRRNIGFALETEVPKEAGRDQGPVRIDLSAAVWGYGWSFPKTHTTTVGIGGLQRYNPALKTAMNGYLEQLGHDPAALKIRGHFIPFGYFRKTPGRDAVLLCGDAAGLVDPVTGEGIAFAIESGSLAAQSAAEALHAKDPASATLHYAKSLSTIHRAITIARMIRPIMFSKHLKGPFARAFAGSTTLKNEYMRLLGGEIEYGDLGRKVLRRLPAMTLRAFKPGSRDRQ
ncbi:Geranylgeranyl reductase [Sulfitobacter noctilucicola]|uniref:Geranylgeranyl reductase family protein n=1 Tax=Sulfitobacter noctilucicola TaxID=1342301 RepID=A0A7W6Q5K5_9RHOB|nr:geranylgeranyl reductase family protein [Sulfitobacter noctilucicola]KIN64033.1 Geranylgeranyl reductase [Sulfitobacter noctilucicola]MBB4175389.1 geranylgeranyl reductase family protein [Sulfitobacter noctilucicola]